MVRPGRAAQKSVFPVGKIYPRVFSKESRIKIAVYSGFLKAFSLPGRDAESAGGEAVPPPGADAPGAGPSGCSCLMRAASPCGIDAHRKAVPSGMPTTLSGLPPRPGRVYRKAGRCVWENEKAVLLSRHVFPDFKKQSGGKTRFISRALPPLLCPPPARCLPPFFSGRRRARTASSLPPSNRPKSAVS